MFILPFYFSSHLKLHMSDGLRATSSVRSSATKPRHSDSKPARSVQAQVAALARRALSPGAAYKYARRPGGGGVTGAPGAAG